jgi:DNA topoisomerase-2
MSKECLSPHFERSYHSSYLYTFAPQELILFSRADLERSIPSMVDGLKPGQRKIIFASFKRNLSRDIKVKE